MADSDLDVVEKALKDIRERYQRLEDRVRRLEHGIPRPGAAEDAGGTRPGSVQSP